MRLVAGLLALTLTGSLAFADEAKAPEPQPAQPETAKGKVGLRVVRVMTESHQALLFDKKQGKHVLADVGSVISGYTVMEIDEDEVTLSSGGRELVLSAPDTSWRRRRGDEEAVAPQKAPAPVAPAAALADPYAPAIETAQMLETPQTVETAEPAKGPTDPYAEPEVRTASATKPAAPAAVPLTNPYDEAALDAALTAGAGSARVAKAPADVTITEMEVDPYGEPATTDAAPATDDGVHAFTEALGGAVIVHAPTPAPAVAAPTPAPAPKAAPPTVLSRKELNAALADFGVLTASVRGAFTPAGARLDVVAEGSVFAKAGLQSGDVITAVDGMPLKSIDDAAELYIRASSARTAKVDVLRAGKPQTLRLAIQ